jgi:hypothetical protein
VRVALLVVLFAGLGVLRGVVIAGGPPISDALSTPDDVKVGSL